MAIVLLLAAILAAVLVGRDRASTSGVVGSGTTASQSRDVPAFTGVELEGSNVVHVVAGGKQSVVVHADSNLLDRVTTRVEHGRLLIGTSGTFHTRSPMSVDVTVPSLSDVTLSGSGVVTAGAVRVPHLTVDLPGSGLLRLSGSVDRLDVTLTGSGDAELQALTARAAHALVGGSGRIVVHATDTLAASVTGTGVIVYTGSPQHVTKVVSGTGAIMGG